MHLHWKKYKEEQILRLKETGMCMAIAGDGRHDSMGHSAKYCAYTLFCCTVPSIVDFSLVQVYLTKNPNLYTGTSNEMVSNAHTHSFESQTSCLSGIAHANFMQFSLLNYVILF